jgi:cell division protein FtsB
LSPFALGLAALLSKETAAVVGVLVLLDAWLSTSSRYLKPSKIALRTTTQRIDAQRRESGETAKWEQDLAELRKNLPQGPQKGPQADRIVRQREVGNTVTPPRINRLGA